MVQRTKFEGADEDHCVGVCGCKCVGHSQPVQGSMTTHESHVCAGHGIGQSQLFNQQQIKTGGTEATARDRDQMGDLLWTETRLFDGGAGRLSSQRWCLQLIPLHAICGRGTTVIGCGRKAIEAFCGGFTIRG